MEHEAAALPVGIADIKAAAARLKGVAYRTPLLRSELLDERAGRRLLIKAEPLQRTGSFKFRGAYNAIASLRPPAVVAFSSGNHAQGVAAAARQLGIKATIVMPSDAPRTKIETTRALGAETILYDRYRDAREAIGLEVAARTGAVLIRPYDEPLVIAGQGTLALEAVAQAREIGPPIDAALVCCGGGGLTAGCAIALAASEPAASVYTAEPEGFDDTARSLVAGKRVGNDPDARSICDALMAPMPGEITFPINQSLVTAGLSVSEAEVRTAMRLAFRYLKLVVEPGGAVALAAALFRPLPEAARTVLVVASGGNVDPELYAEIIGGS